MLLTFDDLERPDDLFVINDRTDGGSQIVRPGDTFEVADRRALRLLADHFPRLTAATT